MERETLESLNITLLISTMVRFVILHTTDQGQQTFSAEGQMENILGFAGYMWSPLVFFVGWG